MQLTGKMAPATAAGQGIGEAGALVMADPGATVVAIDIRRHRLMGVCGCARPEAGGAGRGAQRGQPATGVQFAETRRAVRLRSPRAQRQHPAVARQPLGRLAQAREIAPIVVYRASDESAFASGQVFAVDGGMTI